MVEVKHRPGLAYTTAAVNETSMETEFSNLIAPAFRAEGDVYNALDLMGRKDHQPDPEFEIVDALGRSSLGKKNVAELSRAQSQGEFNDIEKRLIDQARDRDLLMANGLAGMAAMALAGVVSPTIFVPALGPARGLKGIRQAALLASTAAAGQEVVLHANQDERTATETLLNVGASAVIGGIVGAGIIHLRSKAEKRLINDMVHGQRAETISNAAGVSSKSAVEEPTIVVHEDLSQPIPAYTAASKEGDDVVA